MCAFDQTEKGMKFIMEKYIVEKYNIKNISEERVKLHSLLMSFISQNLCSSYLFEFTNVDLDIGEFDYLQKRCAGSDLQKFMFGLEFEGESKKRTFISNLNNSWEYPNPNNNVDIQKEEFISILNHIKDFRIACSTALYGLDEIKWSKNSKTPSKGTYGFDKAKNYFDQGFNYLSNSIIVSKVGIDKNIVMYISYKVNEEEDYFYLNKIHEELGTPKFARTWYAPSTPEERLVWEKKKSEAYDKFLSVLNMIQIEKNNLPHKLKIQYYRDEFTDAINVRKLIKEILLLAGWTFFKKYTESFGTPIKRSKGESDIELYIDATHKGHYLQVLLGYNSKYYSFCQNINYTYELKDEKEVREYLENIKVLGDIIYDDMD